MKNSAKNPKIEWLRIKTLTLKKNRSCLIRFIFIIIIFLVCNMEIFSETIVICLDTSGSMRIDGRIEAAKKAVIKEIQKLKSGDKIWIVTFDTYARLLGKLDEGENPMFKETKEMLIQKISEIRAFGPWTHLEQAVMKAKTILVDRREIAGAKILIFSDGISDPDPSSGVPPIDLEEIATLLPQKLGINVYLISFKEDIAGFFKTEATDSGVVINPNAPHIIGLPVDSYTSEKIENAIKETRKENSKAAFILKKKEKDLKKKNKMPKKEENLDSNDLYVGLIGISILVLFALFAFFIQKRRKEIYSFILETEIGDERQKIEVDLPEGKKKSVGSAGDIQLEPLEDLPSILFSLQRKKGQTWLIPQDAIFLNGLEITNMSQVNSGDIIVVRDKLIFRISERREEGE